MQVGMAFGALLGRVLVDFESKLGGKLDPSWHQIRENWGTKTMSKSHRNSGAATGRNVPIAWSLKILQY